MWIRKFSTKILDEKKMSEILLGLKQFTRKNAAPKIWLDKIVVEVEVALGGEEEDPPQKKKEKKLLLSSYIS